MRIHRAEEQGRQAYKVGGTVDAQERVSGDSSNRRGRLLVWQQSTHARTLIARGWWEAGNSIRARIQVY